MKNELALGNYKIPADATTGMSDVNLHVTGPVPMDPTPTTHFSKKQALEGKFAFTALETGSHKICFRSTAPTTRRIKFTTSIGF